VVDVVERQPTNEKGLSAALARAMARAAAALAKAAAPEGVLADALLLAVPAVSPTWP